MTNAEKYKEVFGFEPEINSCPTHICEDCPLATHKYCSKSKPDWWNNEYKENKGGKKRIARW